MKRVLAITFYFILGVYVVLILLDPQFAPAEEPSYFLKTIQAGKFYPPYISLAEARFQPLHAQEYNLVSRILPAHPFSYYLFNAIQLILFFAVFKKVLDFATKNKNAVYCSLLLLLLSPGFNNAWFRMIVGERGVVFWGILFVFFYIRYMKQVEASSLKRFLLLSLTILCANLSIYYKETMCLAIGAFAICHSIFHCSNQASRTKILKTITIDAFLVLSSVIFLATYYFYIYVNKTGNYLEAGGEVSLVSILKNLIAYLFIDPVLIIGIICVSIHRVSSVIKNRQSPHPLYDSMLVAAIVYISAILALNLKSAYYLLPAYIFAIAAFLFFLDQLQDKSLKSNWLINSALLIAIFIQVTSALPLGIETLSEYKYIPRNANLAADFVVEDISRKTAKYTPSIFLIGIRQHQSYLYNDFAEMLEYRGLSKQQYKTMVSSDSEEAQEGDYFVITPFSQTATKHLADSNNEFLMVFKTNSKWAIPNYGLERILKWLLIKALPQEQAGTLFQESTKLFEPFVDYTVFRVDRKKQRF